MIREERKRGGYDKGGEEEEREREMNEELLLKAV